MKKENRKMAQERRAAERQKQESRRKLKKALLIGIPSLAVLIRLIVIIANSVTSSTSSTEAETELGELLTDTTLTAEDGDTVNIDFVGTIDGEEFDGGSAEGANVTIGSGSYVEGFEEQLIGAHPGDELTLDVTFPEDYQYTDIAGKDAVINVTVNGIYE